MEQNDLEMMKSPYRWVHLVLPLKRSKDSGMPDVGVIYYLDDGACKFHRNVTPFGPLPGADKDGIVTTPEELIADGWIVD